MRVVAAVAVLLAASLAHAEEPRAVRPKPGDRVEVVAGPYCTDDWQEVHNHVLATCISAKGQQGLEVTAAMDACSPLADAVCLSPPVGPVCQTADDVRARLKSLDACRVAAFKVARSSGADPSRAVSQCLLKARAICVMPDVE